ncbi:MAG: 50S ribosomal protein L11 methyltransferase, partial [Clostridia bacterium]|nr:50S ribosomal protein L11 methyltransferase [Clostridia bacterium]
MKFTEFTISTTSEASELVADILWQYTTYGVAVCDYKDVIELIECRRETFDYIEEDLERAKETGALVKAYVELSESETVAAAINEDLCRLAKNAEGNVLVGTLETTKRVVEGDDWIEIWKKHFRPIHYGKIVICPKWISYEAKEHEKIIYIDSNRAFGTGEHETTSMCITLLE